MASRLRLTAAEAKRALSRPVPQPATKDQKPRTRTPRSQFGIGSPVELPADDALLRIRLPIRLTNNNGGRGGSYHASATFRKKCEEYLRAWGLASKPVRFPMPVRVHVIRILGPHERKWDTSSILRGNYKEIEDALVAIGWFPNDTPQWITQTIPDQDDSQRDVGPSIVIEVRGA